MNIFVAKLNYDTSETKLKQAFEAFGEVSSAKIIFDKYENRSKGFGFVEMDDDEQAQAAIAGFKRNRIRRSSDCCESSQPKRLIFFKYKLLSATPPCLTGWCFFY